nr:hypothetical protein [Tanacetum cinerariifolium]
MSTQQDIYAAGSESRPPMLNKENNVPWSSCLLRYAKSRPNGKLIHNSILNGPYVRRMIAEPGDGERDVNVNETFHEQTNDELSERELKQIEADDQAIQTILLGLPEDIYAAVDSCETAQEIWLRVQQMMNGSDIGIQEKKAKTNAEKSNDVSMSSANEVRVLDFATHVIEKNVTKSLEAAVLARTSSQPKSTYEAAASLFRFELIKILLDKMEKSKSHLRADYKKKLYDALVESYNTAKDLFNTYGEVFTLKKSRDDRDKDRDPSFGCEEVLAKTAASNDFVTFFSIT